MMVHIVECSCQIERDNYCSVSRLVSFFYNFSHIVNNSVSFTSYFYIFLLMVVFVFSHSSIPV